MAVKSDLSNANISQTETSYFVTSSKSKTVSMALIEYLDVLLISGLCLILKVYLTNYFQFTLEKTPT